MAFVKDPDAILDYKVDWTSFLGTDTITASSWIAPTGLTQVSASFSDTDATIFLSGGTVGQTYEVTNRIDTAGGRRDDRTIEIEIEQK